MWLHICKTRYLMPGHIYIRTYVVVLSRVFDNSEGCHYSLDWTTGMEHWTGLLEWNTGLDYWTEFFPFLDIFLWYFTLYSNIGI